MPSGIPVATVAINGATNAALLAIQMLAIENDTLANALKDNADIVTVLENSIANKADKTALTELSNIVNTKATMSEIEPTIAFAESEKQKSKNLLDVNNPSGVYGHVCLDISKLEIGKTYTFSCKEPIGWFKISDSASGYNSVAKESSNNDIYTFTFVMTRNSNIPVSRTQYLFLGNGALQTYTYDEIVRRSPQIEEGSVATDYQTYSGEVIREGNASGKYLEREYQKGKNLCYLFEKSQTNRGLTVSYDNLSQEITIDGSGGDADYLVSRNIYPILQNKQGKKYTISLHYVSGTLTNSSYADFCHVRLGSMDVDVWDNEYIITTELANARTLMLTKTIVLDTDQLYDTLRFYIKGNTTANNFKFKVQIEEGDVATHWQYPAGEIVHLDYLDKNSMTLVKSIEITSSGYTELELSNLNFKNDNTYLIEIEGGTTTAADGRIRINGASSGYATLCQSGSDGSTTIGTEIVSTHIPSRFDKYFKVHMLATSNQHNTGGTTHFIVNNFSAPSSNAGNGRYIRNSQGLVGAYPLNKIKFEFDYQLIIGTWIRIYKYGVR